MSASQAENGGSIPLTRSNCGFNIKNIPALKQGRLVRQANRELDAAKRAKRMHRAHAEIAQLVEQRTRNA